MTFGPHGVLALVGDAVAHVPAFAVPVTDTTGAGDAFHAGYAFALSTGRDFLASLEFGSAVAALKCRAWGGRRGLPSLGEVIDLLQTGARRPPPDGFASLLG
jgi:sulfofructose kinase